LIQNKQDLYYNFTMIHSKDYMIRRLNHFATNTEHISCVMQTKQQLHGFKEE